MGAAAATARWSVGVSSGAESTRVADCGAARVSGAAAGSSVVETGRATCGAGACRTELIGDTLDNATSCRGFCEAIAVRERLESLTGGPARATCGARGGDVDAARFVFSPGLARTFGDFRNVVSGMADSTRGAGASATGGVSPDVAGGSGTACASGSGDADCAGAGASGSLAGAASRAACALLDPATTSRSTSAFAAAGIRFGASPSGAGVARATTAGAVERESALAIGAIPGSGCALNRERSAAKASRA